MKQINTPKKIFTTFLPLFLILITTTLNAQKNPAVQKLYAEGGVGATNYKGINTSAGVHAVWKNNWVTGFNYRSIRIEPKNIPKDFDPGYTYILFFPIPNPTPDLDMSIISLEAGKIFKGGRNIWFTTSAGVSFVNANEISFSKAPVNPSWNMILFGESYSNYNYSEKNKNTLGASLKADFNWAFASFAGLGAGVFANFNSIQSPIGMEVKLLVGKMNREKKNKNND